MLVARGMSKGPGEVSEVESKPTQKQLAGEPERAAERQPCFYRYGHKIDTLSQQNPGLRIFKGLKINSFGHPSLGGFACTSKCGDPALPGILNVANADWL